MTKKDNQAGTPTPPVKRDQPFDTKQSGFSLIVPIDEFGSLPSVYKIHFGKKYFIWKGKALKQSCELVAKGISAGLSKLARNEQIPENDYLYHVLKHIKATRCTSGKVELEVNDFEDSDGNFDALKVLKVEQKLLDEATGDPLCLNNNAEAYVPQNNLWIKEPHKKAFYKWLKERRKP
jgi:hypothetical protein